MRLGGRLGLDAAELATLYDVSILTYVGCPVYGNEAALLFGDDIDFRRTPYDVDLAGFPAMVFMLRRAGCGHVGLQPGPPGGRDLMATGGRRWSSRWPTTARPPACSPSGWGWAPTCGPASSSPTPGGTVAASRPTWPATRSRCRRGSRTSPRPARCSSARPASTRPSTS